LIVAQALVRGLLNVLLVVCVARTDADLYELDRQVFVSAVTGHELSHATIVGVVEERLERAGRTSRTTTERRSSQF
jgi:hypothetical protein